MGARSRSASSPARLHLRRQAAIYCRISQDRTGSGLGVDRQESECRELLDRLGWELVDVFVDNDVSAFSGKTRPAYQRMLACVERGAVDAIVVWHADRLHRRPAELEGFIDLVERHHTAVATVRAGDLDLSGASGRMVARLLGATARYESELKGERIKAKHMQSASAGLAHGGTRPYGYDRVTGEPGRLVVVPKEAEVIRDAAARVLAGASVRSIALDLSHRGVPTVKGGPWRAKALVDMLRSPRLAGLRPSGGAAIGGATWEPILDRATWERVAAVLAHPPRGRQPRSFLLAGFLFCGRCGFRLFSATSMNKGIARRRYHCRPEEPGACGRLSIEAGAVEEYLTGLVLGSADGVDLSSTRAKGAEVLVAQMADDEQMLGELATDLGERRISRSEWMSARAPIDKRLTDTKARLARISPAESLPRSVVDLTSDWDGLSFEQRRTALGLFIERAFVEPAKPARRLNPNRIRVVWRA